MGASKYQVEDTYILSTDEIAGGANKAILDIFNPVSSGKKLMLTHLFIIPKSDVAVTGVVSARFDLYRTSAAGTGGTANSYRSPASNAINIVPCDPAAPALLDQGITNEKIVAGIRARSAPTGGATKKHWLFPAYVFPEETAANGTLAQGLNLVAVGDVVDPIIIGRGEGLLIEQGSVASVNSFVVTAVFCTVGVPSV